MFSLICPNGLLFQYIADFLVYHKNNISYEVHLVTLSLSKCKKKPCSAIPMTVDKQW